MQLLNTLYVTLPDSRLRLDNDTLRVDVGQETRLRVPFEPVLAFAFKDESFIGNLEQCNGCGGCRKDAPTMCPTFLATGEMDREGLDLFVEDLPRVRM